MVGAQGDGNAVGLTGAGAFPLTQVTAVGQSFDVMVMAFLGQADFIFEAENLGPVFAQRAVHRRFAAEHFLHPFDKGVEHQRMIAEIGRRDELHIRMVGGDQFGVLTNPADEHTREQEVGKHHDAAKAEFDDVAQAGLHQWEGDAGVDGFSPAEAEPLHQHPRHLGDI